MPAEIPVRTPVEMFGGIAARISGRNKIRVPDGVQIGALTEIPLLKDPKILKGQKMFFF